MKELFCILILVVPSVSWKLFKDREGVQHPNNKEASSVFLIMFIGLLFVKIILNAYMEPSTFATSSVLSIKCWCVAISGFGLFFTYLFNWFWFPKYSHGNFSDRIEYTLTHLSDSAIPDKWPAWRACGWLGRLLIYITLFSLSVIWFVL